MRSMTLFQTINGRGERRLPLRLEDLALESKYGDTQIFQLDGIDGGGVIMSSAPLSGKLRDQLTRPPIRRFPLHLGRHLDQELQLPMLDKKGFMIGVLQ